MPRSKQRAVPSATTGSPGDPQSIPIAFGGSFLAGDPAAIPEGYVRLVHNMLPRPGRFDARPPSVYDGVQHVVSLMIWEDLQGQATHLIAMDTSRQLWQKAASGETWTGPIAGPASGTRVIDYANYRGKLYFLLDDGAGTPITAAVYDGSVVSSAPFDSTLTGKSLTSFVDRLFVGGARIVITPLGGDPLTYAYDWTNPPFVPTNVDVNNITISPSQVVCRLSPTSKTASACKVESFNVVGFNQGIITVPASTKPSTVTWRAEFRGVDSLSAIPFTMELILIYDVRSSIGTQTVSLGYITTGVAADGNRYIFRVTTAGTYTGAEPTWPSQPGATVTDGGGVVWTNIGSSVIAANEGFVQPASVTPGFTPYFVQATVDPRPNNVTIGFRLKLYNSAQTALTVLSPIDISLKDGKLDTDPSKDNHGQQFTTGSYYYPFFNKEIATSTTRNLESWVWSETSQPSLVRGANNYEPKEAAGLPTAACVLSGRYVAAKRRAIWTFKATGDPDTPILPESPAQMGVGILGGRALGQLNDELWFIGEYEVYRMRIGYPPRPICGDAMREAIMGRGSGWVENQGTYNNPLLAIDPLNHEVWVYTQKGYLFCYHIPSAEVGVLDLPYQQSPLGLWTRHDIAGQEVSDMCFSPTTGRMYFALGGKDLVRFDESLTQQDQVDHGLAFSPGTCDIILKPFELYSPRYELAIHEIGIYHLATLNQSTEQLWIYTSTDRGATFPHYNEVQFDVTQPRIPVSIFPQFGLSVMPKISHVGSMGRAAWSVSRGDAMLEILGGEWPYSQPTSIGSNL